MLIIALLKNKNIRTQNNKMIKKERYGVYELLIY